MKLPTQRDVRVEDGDVGLPNSSAVMPVRVEVSYVLVVMIHKGDPCGFDCVFSSKKLGEVFIKDVD